MMDFLSVCDSGDWGDSCEAKDLNSKLFHPQTGPVEPSPNSKKSKATKKKQKTVSEIKSDRKDAKTLRKKKTSEKLQCGSVNEKAEVDGGQVQRETVKSKRKKKRKMDASKSEVPVKKKKTKRAVSSVAVVAQEEQNEVQKSQQNDQNETRGEDGTIGDNPKTKKRKRKPRNNKFKTAEFGYVAKPSATKISGDESKIPNGSGKSFARASDSVQEGDDRKRNNKGSRKAKVKNSTKTKGTERTPSVDEVDGTKEKIEGAQLSSPGGKMKKKASENLEQRSNTEKKVSEKKKKRNNKAKRTNSENDSEPSKNENRPLKRQQRDETLPAENEKAEGGKLSIRQDEDMSKEPLPDLSAKQALKSKMEAQLQSAHFRFLNERLYKTTGSEAQRMMSQDREAFDIYHQGFALQVRQWPVNPVDKFIEDLKSRPANLIVGDFGCGEARIAQSVNQKVHSFDLCALNKHVTVCDMEKVPLKSSSLDIAIFCLSLMGTNWVSYVKEANRVLKVKGQLKVAEVASRFASVAEFLKIMKQLGFKKESKDYSNKMFLMFDLTKEAPPRKVELEWGEVLKPCLYKRR